MQPNVVSVCFGCSVCTVLTMAGDEVMIGLVSLLEALTLLATCRCSRLASKPQHSRLIHNPVLLSTESAGSGLTQTDCVLNQ